MKKHTRPTRRPPVRSQPLAVPKKNHDSAPTAPVPEWLTDPKPFDTDGEQRPYTPHLADWDICPVEQSQADPHSFIIRSSDEGKKPVVIATVKVNEMFSVKNARGIARFMAWAPALWQELQRAAPYMLSVDSPTSEFAEVLDTLWQAAGQFPFEWPAADEGENEVIRWNSDTVITQIASGIKAPKEVQS